MHLSRFSKILSQILILAMIHLCWLTSYGWAEMLPTESSLLSQEQINTDRQRLLDLLDRQEVVDELEKYGISKVEAVARINSLTDEEVTQISGKLDELPAGGYGEIIILVIVAGYLAIYIFGLLPGLLLYCPFSEYSYGKCISKYSGEYWDGWKKGFSDEGGGEGPDPNAGEQYCKTDCQSDLESCIESADGEKSEEQECEEDKNSCDKKCSDWAEGFQGSESSSGEGGFKATPWFGGGGTEDTFDNRREYHGSSSGEMQTAAQCHSHCFTAYHGCINIGDGTVDWETQCDAEKQACSQQCDTQVRGKWCQNPDTNEWVPCEDY